jgi:hypothetical protein
MKNVSDKLDHELKNCNNMEQVLAAVNKHYDLSRPFGIATKLLVITGVKKILDLVKAQPRETWTK